MRTLLSGSVLAVLIVLGQTNVLRLIEINHVQPDLPLIVIVFLAHYHGSLVGESVGFIAGLSEDLLSLSPPGFNALVRTLIGYLSGVTQTRMLLDPVFMPILLMVGASLLKLLLVTVLAVLFSFSGIIDPLPAGTVAIELAYTSLLAPIVFAILRVIPVLRPEQRL